jgi:hypothetical protein
VAGLRKDASDALHGDGNVHGIAFIVIDCIPAASHQGVGVHSIAVPHRRHRQRRIVGSRGGARVRMDAVKRPGRSDLPIEQTIACGTLSPMARCLLHNRDLTRPWRKTDVLKTFILIGAVSLTVLTSAPALHAQTFELGRDGIRIIEPDLRNRRDGRDQDRRAEISERQAVRIAKGEGVRIVDDIRRTRSRYVIEGLDRRGNEIEVSVDRRSGDVLSVN